MADIDRLFNRFTNKKKRTESDCRVVTEVCEAHAASTSEEVRRDVVTWLFKRLEDRDTNPLACRLAYKYLKKIRLELSTKRRRRFRKFVNKLRKAKRKGNLTTRKRKK